MRVEVVVRRGQRIDVVDRRALGAQDHALAVAVRRAGDADQRRLGLDAGQNVQERGVALAEGDEIDLRVVKEHLGRQRRRVRPADHDGRVRTELADSLGDDGHAAAVRRPARHAVDVGVDRPQHFIDPRPRESREVDDLDGMPRPHRLRAEREEAVGGLMEVRVEVAFAIIAGGTVGAEVGGFAGRRDLPGRGI